MRIPVLALSLLALAAASCGTTTDTTYTCVVVTPDAGTSDLLCNVAWSCNNDVNHYGLQCRFAGGNYACDCVVENSVVKSFSVAAFDCSTDPANALPAATTACGWAIQLQ
jgi:hypothetical protein